VIGDVGTYLDHGALGAAVLVMLVSMSMLYRTLLWTRELMEMVLNRIQDNTRALTALVERLGGYEEVP
jgi:hypothetical protein